MEHDGGDLVMNHTPASNGVAKEETRPARTDREAPAHDRFLHNHNNNMRIEERRID